MKKRRRLKITKPKTDDEISSTKRAIEIVNSVLREMDNPFGRREKDVARDIRKRIRGMGADLSFMPIVASGRNSSHVHHRPGKKIVREDEPVIFDLGARCNGLCSDITRMHIPDNPKFREIFRDACKIQKSMISSIRPGIEFKKLQEMYVNLMNGRRYKVRHLFGHGIGGHVHERVKSILKEGMIITVEPGIYIKNLGGCRIEDMILVKRDGAKILSDSIRMNV